jgi:hypothetical protein
LDLDLHSSERYKTDPQFPNRLASDLHTGKANTDLKTRNQYIYELQKVQLKVEDVELY